MNDDLHLLKDRYREAVDHRPGPTGIDEAMLGAKFALKDAYEEGTVRAMRRADRAITRFEAEVLEARKRQDAHCRFEDWLSR